MGWCRSRHHDEFFDDRYAIRKYAWRDVGVPWREPPTSSKRSPTAAFLAAEISVAVLPGFRVRPAPVLRGLLYDRDQGQTP